MCPGRDGERFLNVRLIVRANCDGFGLKAATLVNALDVAAAPDVKYMAASLVYLERGPRRPSNISNVDEVTALITILENYWRRTVQ